MDNVLRKGKHKALINMELWEKCQKRKKIGQLGKVHRKNNSHFPLRGFLQLECGHNATAAFSKGLTKKYGYYFCPKRDSGNYRTDLIHEKFEELLVKIQPDKESIDIFMELFSEEIKDSFERHQQYQKTLMIKKDSIAEKKNRLLDLRIDGEIDEISFRTKKSELEKELLHIEQSQSLKDKDIDWVKIINFAKNFFVDILGRWEQEGIIGKKLIISSIFAQKLQWVCTEFRTPVLPEVFYAFSSVKSPNVSLTQRYTNFSPYLYEL